MKTRNYDFIVTTADGETQTFRTYSTADFFRKIKGDTVTSFKKVHQGERYELSRRAED